MIIMALDHTRDFFHYDSFVHDPLDLSTTTPVLFFTRWITHFCAPVFVFLTGTSIYLQSFRKPPQVLMPFLIKRGLWLIFIECVVITFAWTFDFCFSVIILQVIWAIGMSMILMGFLIRLPYKFILFGGLLLIAGHNVLDYFPSTHSGVFWDLFRNGDFADFSLPAGRSVVIIYPFAPWLGIMMIGYAFGKLFEAETDPPKRKRFLLFSGCVLIVAFIFIRLLNGYGDPHYWSLQKNWLVTLFSFVNVNKYPPSLLYTCMTIGPALLFLGLTESYTGRISQIIQVYGKVPFLYYVLHFYVLHLLCMVLFVLRGHSFNEVLQSIYGIPFRFVISGEGYPLTIVYLIWIGIVLALYPVCKWYSDLKARNKSWWLSYL